MNAIQVQPVRTSADVKRKPFGINALSDVDPSEVLRVFMKSLDLKNKDALKALEKEWHDYVTRELKAVTPRGLEKAGLKVARSWPERPIKAKNLLQKAGLMIQVMNLLRFIRGCQKESIP